MKLFPISMLKDKEQLHSQTQMLFQNYTEEEITDDIAEEIERNLKDFFQLLLCWNEDVKAKNGHQKGDLE